MTRTSTRRDVGIRAAVVPTNKLELHPQNVRRDYGDLRELADSIREHGVIEPLIVEDLDGMGRVLAGHRRLLAARQAGVTRVPVLLRPPVGNDAAIAIMVNENRHRMGLTRAEKRAAAQSLMSAYGWSKAAVARGFAVSPQTITNWLADSPEDTADPGGVDAARAQLVDKAAQRAQDRARGVAPARAPASAGQHHTTPGKRSSMVSARLVRQALVQWEEVLPDEFAAELRRILGEDGPQ